MNEIWPRVEHDRELLEYLPDRRKLATKHLDRAFFWGVLQARRPEFCEALVREAQDKRSEI